MVLSQIMSGATKVAATDRYVKSRLMSGLPSGVATGLTKASAVNDVKPSLDHAARSFRLAAQPCHALEPDRAAGTPIIPAPSWAAVERKRWCVPDSPDTGGRGIEASGLRAGVFRSRARVSST